MMITAALVISLHHRMIETSGGMHGVRDLSLLDSAIASIYQTFDKKDLYPTLLQKICRLSYNLNTSHAFIDGNKRISMHMLALMLRFNEFNYRPTNEEVIDVGQQVANHQMDYEDLLEWVQSKVK
ncbi:MAG: type II toxin-antitoxin system death-on-curing family toxin [Candidatus Izemoplasmatales bacterium]